MQNFELMLLDGIQHIRCGVLDALLVPLSRSADHGEIWILLALVLLLMRRYRKDGVGLSCALVLDLISCNMVIKPLVGRIRPFVLNPAIRLLVPAPTDASFPSGHAAAAFAAAAALKTVGNPLWKPALGLAVLLAFSRLYLYVHWPSDVFFGALLGVAVGWCGGKAANFLWARRKEKEN